MADYAITNRQVLALGCIVCLNSLHVRADALIYQSAGKTLPLCSVHQQAAGSSLWEARHGTVSSLHEQVVCMIADPFHGDRHRINHQFRQAG